MRQLKLTQMRKRADVRSENIKYMQAVRKNKERATRQTERHYLNQVLLQQLTPQLRQTVLRRKFDLDGFLN